MAKRSERKRAAKAGGTAAAEPIVRRHLLFGWWSLLLFLALGLVLEALHGFKVGWYLDVTHQSRRFMWTLAHAHGTLLALVNLAYAAAVPRLAEWGRRAASGWLLAGSLLLPIGFFLAGFVTYGGDPGLSIAVAALGGLVLLVAVLLVALAVSRTSRRREESG